MVHRFLPGVYCTTYGYPEAKWSYGNCPMATHIKKEEKKATKQMDPLKASKKRAKGGVI
jgi:hypothetical protein